MLVVDALNRVSDKVKLCAWQLSHKFIVIRN